MKLRLARKLSLLVLATYRVWTLAACGTAISGTGSDDDCCEQETEDCCNVDLSDDCCDDGSGNAALAEFMAMNDSGAQATPILPESVEVVPDGQQRNMGPMMRE